MGDLDDIARDGPPWFRYLVIAALFSSAGTGFLSLNKEASEGYTAAHAGRDFQERDKRIDELMKYAVNHSAHSARYSEKIDRLQKDVEEIRRELDAHVRGHGTSEATRQLVKSMQDKLSPEKRGPQ